VHGAITKTNTFEVSPVIIGAGVGTRTVGVKAADALPDPAIEAARIKAEQAAEAARVEAERKSRIEAEASAAMDRRFNRGLPAGVDEQRLAQVR
jgi:hypothetical protein